MGDEVIEGVVGLARAVKMHGTVDPPCRLLLWLRRAPLSVVALLVVLLVLVLLVLMMRGRLCAGASRTPVILQAPAQSAAGASTTIGAERCRR